MSWKQRYKTIWKHHSGLFFSVHVFLFLFVASDFLVGSKPLVCQYKQEYYSMLWNGKSVRQGPLFADLNSIAQGNYRNLEYDFAIWPLIYRDEKELDPESAWFSPGSKMKDGRIFFLGSYDLGRDLFSACIIGFIQSVKLALLTLLISLFPAILIGSLAVFHSRRYRQISILSAALFSCALFLLLYVSALCFEWKELPESLFPVVGLFVLMVLVAYFARNMGTQMKLNFDTWSLRYLEIMKSIPVILILLILLQIIPHPNRIQFAFLLSFIFIPHLVKYARAFTLKTADEDYITATIALGQSGMMIFIKHILPGLMRDLIPVIAFGIANLILLEASLSFIGFGFELDQISLGGLLFSARANPSAWWVVVFPGFLIFWLVLLFNRLGQLFAQKNVLE